MGVLECRVQGLSYRCLEIPTGCCKSRSVIEETPYRARNSYCGHRYLLLET